MNREIAQYVYNKKASNDDTSVNTSAHIGDAAVDSPKTLAIETKKDLLSKIHVKNKYIKRLIIENDAHKEEINRQKEQILLLNVSLKQTAHKLTKAIGDLLEQKKQNHMTANDMADLHAKINSVREQMTRIEYDKQKYKHDVLYLGDEIQKKINHWNEMLKRKYENYHDDCDDVKPNTIETIENISDIQSKHQDDYQQLKHNNEYMQENHIEVNVLSQAISKRNAIINKMESLLIDLTLEISQSAAVINRIIKNLSQRETNFASNLEKLRNHLAKLLERPNTCVESETQTIIPQAPSTSITSKHFKRKISKKKLHDIKH